MSFLKKTLASFGVGAARVDSILHDDFLLPGEKASITVEVYGGATPQEIDNIDLRLCCQYMDEEQQDNDGDHNGRERKVQRTFALASWKLPYAFTIEPGQQRDFQVELDIPWNTPVTIGDAKVWLETGLDISMAVDPTDKDILTVRPDPLLDAVLTPLSASDKRLFRAMRSQDADNKSHKKSRYKSIDCSIMEIADDIAYGVHDLEDAIAMGIISKSLWQEKVATQLAEIDDFCLTDQITEITNNLFSQQHFKRKDAIGALVNALITSIEIKKVDEQFTDPLLAYIAYLTAAMFSVLNILKQFVLKYVIKSPDLQILEYRGQQIVMELFEAFNAGPMRFLPEPIKCLWEAQNGDESREKRVLADYISSLTDNHALRLHARLFSSYHTSPMIGQHAF